MLNSKPACPVCQSASVTEEFPVKSWLEANQSIESPVHKFAYAMEQNNGYGISTICRCEACGLRFADPYPENSALSDFYQQYYANKNYGAKIDKKIRRAKKRIQRLNKNREYKTFLDVGCNIGTAVEAARRCGLEATGIEIDGEAIKMARELFLVSEFKVTSAEEFAKTGRRFDIIYTTEVIEHVRDINSFMEALYNLLSPQGVLYLTTPDAGHFRTPGDMRCWHEMKLPEHISLFTKPALEQLLARHHFPKARFQFNWKPGIRMTVRKEVA